MAGRSFPSLNEKGASAWDLVLKILSITLVTLFAFSSGIWFGKKLSDSDYQRQALEGEFDREVKKSVADTHDSNHGDDDDHEALTDEEVAAATNKALEAQRKPAEAAPASHGHGVEEKASTIAAHGGHAAPATKPLKADAHAASAHAAPAQEVKAPASAHSSHAAPAHETKAPAVKPAKSDAHDSAKPDLSAAHQAAARVANNAAPTASANEHAVKESRVPSSLPKTVGASSDVEFTVQVASYPTADAAREHVESMVKKGFPAFPVEAKINGKTWYRVSVGSFKSFGDASKFRAQLLKQADLPSAIVQKIAR